VPFREASRLKGSAILGESCASLESLCTGKPFYEKLIALRNLKQTVVDLLTEWRS